MAECRSREAHLLIQIGKELVYKPSERASLLRLGVNDETSSTTKWLLDGISSNTRGVAVSKLKSHRRGTCARCIWARDGSLVGDVAAHRQPPVLLPRAISFEKPAVDGPRGPE